MGPWLTVSTVSPHLLILHALSAFFSYFEDRKGAALHHTALHLSTERSHRMSENATGMDGCRQCRSASVQCHICFAQPRSHPHAWLTSEATPSWRVWHCIILSLLRPPSHTVTQLRAAHYSMRIVPP